jgi:hypothetical protein
MNSGKQAQVTIPIQNHIPHFFKTTFHIFFLEHSRTTSTLIRMNLFSRRSTFEEAVETCNPMWTLDPSYLKCKEERESEYREEEAYFESIYEPRLGEKKPFIESRPKKVKVSKLQEVKKNHHIGRITCPGQRERERKRKRGRK